MPRCLESGMSRAAARGCLMDICEGRYRVHRRPLPDFRQGMLQSKTEFIHSIASGVSDFVTIDLSEQKITISGNTAIVRHVLSATTNDAGKGPGKVKIGILLVWVKSKSGWHLLARQAVKVV